MSSDTEKAVWEGASSESGFTNRHVKSEVLLQTENSPYQSPEEINSRILELNKKTTLELLRRKPKERLAAIINLALVKRGQSPMSSGEIANQVHGGLVTIAYELFSEPSNAAGKQ